MKFAKSYRLLNSSDYQFVFDKPIKRHQDWGSVYARPNTLTHPRLGLIVAKKAMKRAVARNRVKRLVRESFRLHAAALKPFDIIFIARAACQDIENKDFFEGLDSLWEQLA